MGWVGPLGERKRGNDESRAQGEEMPKLSHLGWGEREGGGRRRGERIAMVHSTLLGWWKEKTRRGSEGWVHDESVEREPLTSHQCMLNTIYASSWMFNPWLYNRICRQVLRYLPALQQLANGFVCMMERDHV